MSAAVFSRLTSPEPVDKESHMPTEQTMEPESEGSVVSSKRDIARLAYALWERRGCPSGSPETDWLEAEAQLRE